MTDVETISRLQALTGSADTDLLTALHAEAVDFVLAYTNRTSMISQLEKPVRDLAVIAYNRMGTEGEASRSGSGESYSFDNAPKQIYDVLNRYRLARVGGVVHEAKA